MSEEVWRKKYLSVLEQRERETGYLVQLKKGLVQLCVAAQGQGASLDALLLTLRQKVQQEDFSELEGILNQIGQCLRALEDRAPSASAGPLPPLPEERVEKRGFWQKLGRLFWSESQEETEAALKMVELPEALRQVLLALIESCSTQESLQAPAQALRARALQELSLDALQTLLFEIAQLITQALSLEQVRVGDFLTHLDDHLDQSQRVLDATHTQHRVLQEQGGLLNENMRAVAVGMEADLAQLPEPALPFGHRLKNHLGTLVGYVDAYQALDHERTRLLEEQIGQLKARIEATESDTATLKEHLQEQKLVARRDPLTQLPNRLAFDEFMSHLSLEQPQGFFLALADIDHFKTINDRYGHLAGDKVLVQVAKLLGQNLPEGAFLGRYGGEEFVLVYPTTQEEQMRALLDVLREAVGNCGFHFRGAPVRITVSWGGSFCSGQEPSAQVVSRADSALYGAKKAGRNRVELC